jgi:hypothetical protein
MGELATLQRRKELVLLSCNLQRATLTRRLGRIQHNPVRRALGAAANAVSKPMVWRLGSAAIAFAVKAYRNRSRRKARRGS